MFGSLAGADYRCLVELLHNRFFIFVVSFFSPSHNIHRINREAALSSIPQDPNNGEYQRGQTCLSWTTSKCLSNLHGRDKGLCLSLSISFFLYFKLYIKRKQREMVFKSWNTCYSLVQLAAPLHICSFSLSALSVQMLTDTRSSADTILTCYKWEQLNLTLYHVPVMPATHIYIYIYIYIWLGFGNQFVRMWHYSNERFGTVRRWAICCLKTQFALTDSPTDSRTRSLTHSLTHSLTDSLPDSQLAWIPWLLNLK